MNEQLCLIKEIPIQIFPNDHCQEYSAVDKETRARNLKGIAEARRLLAEKRKCAAPLAA
tara:strand:- start:217 stop:393 length:177 start_codon:yes stop_codon:yes gene_type:complete